jgi:peroxiredoxin Q/BCP
MPELKVGDPAPDFTLPDAEGNGVRRADYAGRHLVVYFYPADDTPGCTKEACQFTGLLDAFDEAGAELVGIAEVVGISADSHDPFRKKHGLKVKLLSDVAAHLAGLRRLRREGALR